MSFLDFKDPAHPVTVAVTVCALVSHPPSYNPTTPPTGDHICGIAVG